MYAFRAHADPQVIFNCQSKFYKFYHKFYPVEIPRTLHALAIQIPVIR